MSGAAVRRAAAFALSGLRLRRVRAGALVAVLLGLAGCQALPGAGAEGAGAAPAVQGPLLGGDIEVTSLDAADSEAEGSDAADTAMTGARVAAGAAMPPSSEPLSPVPDSMPGAPAQQSPQPSDPAQDALAAPVVIKSAAHLACESRGGIWSRTGGGAAAFCQTPARDAGKSCRASTDCTGYCLAQSGTCAPVSPMLGCHDILNDQGRMLTQCVN